MINAISIEKLIIQSYYLLGKRDENTEISFEELHSEIADDSDHHRTRVGYMSCDRAKVFQWNGKIWAVSKRIKTGQYPGSEYIMDIVAVNLESRKNLEKDIQEALGKTYRFRNSLVIGRKDGVLLTSGKRGRFGPIMFNIIGQNIVNFIAEETKYDNETLDADSLCSNEPRLNCIKSRTYKPEFSKFLAETYKKVLKSC